jgi:two-component system response regulator
MTDYNDIDVLIAEDSPTDAEMTIRALKKSNLANKLHWVKDGEEALDFLYCRNTYAARDPLNQLKLLLLDLKMPKVDGFDVLKIIKADERLSSVPVVVMTSSSQERDMVESYRLGVNSYVVKPIEFASFTEAVVELGMYWLLVNASAT